MHLSTAFWNRSECDAGIVNHMWNTQLQNDKTACCCCWGSGKLDSVQCKYFTCHKFIAQQFTNCGCNIQIDDTKVVWNFSNTLWRGISNKYRKFCKQLGEEEEEEEGDDDDVHVHVGSDVCYHVSMMTIRALGTLDLKREHCFEFPE